jgi:fumarate hydratase class II
MATRIETDALGPIEVDADRLWGAQTERARRSFAFGQERMPREMIVALAEVKKAAALANRALGRLSDDKCRLVVAAAEEVASGALDAEFPLGVWQTGSGTQTNMNVNEVIAHRADELAGARRGDEKPVHPNDDVNASQSTNDAFPTAMHVAVARAVGAELLPRVEALRDTLAKKAHELAEVVKIGRTHLMDATPLTLGQEISGWVAELDAAGSAVLRALPGLYEIALGGTAVGTGFGAPRGFAERATAELAAITRLPLVSAPNKFQALAGHEAVVLMHGALKVLACALVKIANDVRLLSSGPRAGLGEVQIPANEPGSSMMPGKVNPTQAEALLMVAAQVMGNDVAVTFAGASGTLELNVMKPLLAHATLQSARLLAGAVSSFDERCAAGIEPDLPRIAAHVAASLMLVTALVPALGYDAAARIARDAHARGTTLREAAIASGLLDGARFDEIVRPELMIGPTAGERM